MQKQKLFLLQQGQVIELCEQKKVLRVVIERISLKKWYPIFIVNNEQEGEVSCSIRPEKSDELRTWADLRTLTEFLMQQCNVKECLLKLENHD